MPKTVIVVPCYNEEKRLDPTGFTPLLAAPDVELLFVDDGSTDDTHAALLRIEREHPERVWIMKLTRNQGKAQAVRLGMRNALEQGAEIVGYLDADLSTPAREMYRLVRVLREAPVRVVLGARVRLLGSAIERSPMRHYLGRVFGTIASLVLRLSVYDTQCGAKLFRDTPALRSALETPFASRWAFDVELIGRLISPPGGIVPLTAGDFLEVPLHTWTHVPASKLKARSMVRAALDLAAIGMRLRRPH